MRMRACSLRSTSRSTDSWWWWRCGGSGGGGGALRAKKTCDSFLWSSLCYEVSLGTNLWPFHDERTHS